MSKSFISLREPRALDVVVIEEKKRQRIQLFFGSFTWYGAAAGKNYAVFVNSSHISNGFSIISHPFPSSSSSESIAKVTMLPGISIGASLINFYLDICSLGFAYLSCSLKVSGSAFQRK